LIGSAGTRRPQDAIPIDAKSFDLAFVGSGRRDSEATTITFSFQPSPARGLNRMGTRSSALVARQAVNRIHYDVVTSGLATGFRRCRPIDGPELVSRSRNRRIRTQREAQSIADGENWRKSLRRVDLEQWMVLCRSVCGQDVIAGVRIFSPEEVSLASVTASEQTPDQSMTGRDSILIRIWQQKWSQSRNRRRSAKART